MNTIETKALINLPEVQEAFLDAILAVASAKLPALAALGINVDGQQTAASVQAQALHQMLTSMLKMQGVDLATGNIGQPSASQHEALLRFMRLCIALVNPVDDIAIWPFTTLADALDAVADGSINAAALATVSAYYAIIAANIETPPAQVMAAAPWRRD